MNLYPKFSLMTPLNLSYLWNLGSLLGLLMLIQIFSGLLLSIYYDTSSLSFAILWMVHLEVNQGFVVHFVHLNIASWLFCVLYFHFYKGMLMNSFSNLKLVWISGWTLLLLSMLVAFMGYVLPWGQMSLWGATVISNLMTVIPFVGEVLVYWVWGGFFVSTYTLKLFFTLHFLLPLFLITIITLHIFLLHFSGSSNPLGGSLGVMKEEFSVSYIYKDFLNMIFLIMISKFLLSYPYFFSDPENFILANPLVSPIHIQPEWYFLPYYAILRAIPNKMGGVMCFVLSLFTMLLMFLLNTNFSFYNYKLWVYFMSKYMVIFLSLMWLGGCLVESPFLILSQGYSLMLFWFYMFIFFGNKKMFY